MIAIIGFALNPVFVFAQSERDIQKSISEKNDEIQALQREIDQYQKQVSQISGQAQTLQAALDSINKNEKALQTKIALTNKKIEKTTLMIKQNEARISDLARGIVSNTSALNETIRSMNQNDNTSLLEILASRSDVSDFLIDVDNLIKVQSSVKGHVIQMRDTKTALEVAQKQLAKDREDMVVLQAQLNDQKKIIDAEQQEKSTLLAQTKNEESQYQALLADRQAKVDALNAEIFAYESQLKFTLNAQSLPGQGALGWPLADVLITQRFGATVDAKRLYVSGSHSGVDFRAAVGTPVYAAADGIVEGVGDTDKVCYRASFGKWVFIRHYNGLATVYGHLSLIKAVEGQKVTKGTLIGYSGNTGHSTGPHLHLTVFASKGVNGEEGARVDSKPSVSCNGKVYRMPIAPTSAYLDPLLYLPKAGPSLFKDGKGSTSE